MADSFWKGGGGSSEGVLLLSRLSKLVENKEEVWALLGTTDYEWNRRWVPPY